MSHASPANDNLRGRLRQIGKSQNAGTGAPDEAGFFNYQLSLVFNQALFLINKYQQYEQANF
ncbi:hypothetical protein QFZ51_004902 [Chitinophaga sp. W3I9]|uniref:hypothetical protein n=1 Tax=Chitinophaga sp. W3I9 TaxID=3373924 RepID=UPI003D25864A